VLANGELTLFTNPRHEFAEFLVSQQCPDGVIRTSEFFLAWYQIVDRSVAITAHRNGLLHLLARKASFEPFIAVTRAWNQMMVCRPVSHHASAKPTLMLLFHDSHRLPIQCSSFVPNETSSAKIALRSSVGTTEPQFIPASPTGRCYLDSRSRAAAVIVMTPVRKEGSTSG
jgi:hypothetical protein